MSIVRKATDADLTRLCRTAIRAFSDDPLMRWLYPVDDEYFAGDGRVLRSVFRRWLAHDQTFTTDDCVAVGAFVPPGRPSIDIEPEPGDGPYSPELLEKFDAMRTFLGAHTPAEPHWYLNMLATHPDWQRQGLGVLLLEPVGEMCRQVGIPLYLETETESNVAYYGHLGFRVRSEWDMPLDGPHMWGMIRVPMAERF